MNSSGSSASLQGHSLCESLSTVALRSSSQSQNISKLSLFRKSSASSSTSSAPSPNFEPKISSTAIGSRPNLRPSTREDAWHCIALHPREWRAKKECGWKVSRLEALPRQSVWFTNSGAATTLIPMRQGFVKGFFALEVQCAEQFSVRAPSRALGQATRAAQ